MPILNLPLSIQLGAYQVTYNNTHMYNVGTVSNSRFYRKKGNDCKGKK